MEKLKEKLKIKTHVGNLKRVVDLAEIRGDIFLAKAVKEGEGHAGPGNRLVETFILYNDALKYSKKTCKKEKEDMEIYLGEQTHNKETHLATIKFNNSH